MRIKLFLALLVLCAISTPAQLRANRKTVSSAPVKLADENANAAQLPIKRVILYSNGVAYIERRGYVSGNAEINLSFKQSQVDDVLKSMVVLDLGQGRIGAVSYNSSAPPSAKMAEIPFSVDAQSGAATGIAGVLSQLQGAKVAVASGKGVATGSILTVEKRQTVFETNKPPMTKTFLVIASESGEISSFDLDEVRSVKLLDEGTRRDVNEFATASASTRRRDAKTITVTSSGSGQREMIVSYTISAPIWKTTYRVVLDQEGKPFFQGWAIVDNVSDEDWKDVKLSLISGLPISFIQPIQQPFYRYRPVVPIPNDLKLSPQVYDEGGRLQSSNGSASGNGNGSGSTADVVSNQQIQNLPLNGRNFQNYAQLAPGVSAQYANSNTFVVDGQEIQGKNRSLQGEVSVSDALTGGNSGVQTAASGEELGDLFEYKIDQPMTVLRDRSALIPIVQAKLEGERAAIYNEATRRDRPMSGMLLKNLTPLTFESGSLTVIDRDAYAGEALMERLKPKEQRLISFALDLGTSVRVRNNADREAAKLVKVVNGVFQVHFYQTNEKVYQIENQTDKPKVLYVEYPVRDGWTLTDDTPKPDYTTQRYHRFRVELKPFDKTELKVGERQALMESYSLTDISQSDIQLFLTRRYIDEATKAKLEKLIDLRVRINQIDQRIEAVEDESEKITNDQKRLRENIEALAKTPEAKTLIARYIAKANEQETRLETIEKETAQMEADKAKLEAELAVEIRNFVIK
ncbi:MAG TPA: hypothetical protein PKY59_14045 [Pyrinomonadaceae bacterium]|nr:hypothetical protein [Pyrinomonadaceae bacterium]